MPHLYQRHLDRAVRALNMGDRLADPLQPSRRDLAVDAAIAVYGQGLYWALTADAKNGLPAGLHEAWTYAAPELLAAATDQAGLDRALDALARGQASRAEMTDAQQEEDLGAVRVVLRGLISTLERWRPPRRRVAWRRWISVALVAVAAVVLVVGAVKLFRRGDLAAGKPWIASSATNDCELSTGICQGQAVDLFVHTRQEESPWVRIDLGAPQRFSSITVTNRLDCCEDRAVPLILEVGLDGTHFSKVAEQKQLFTEWKAKFSPVLARYVRARVARNSTLHLARIEVR